MTKQRTSCNEEEEEPLIIQINQAQRGRSCDCHTEGKEVIRGFLEPTRNEAAPFPFKGEERIALPLSIGSRRSTVSSDGSESTLSVVTINSPPSKLPLELPLVSPREHGPGCALEVSVLEKHADGCSYKKRDKEGRHPMDDTVGSYDVVSRMVYRTCAGNRGIDDHGDAIKNSLKSFRLNDPTFFGKDLKEKRSRIETLPILPNYDNCVMRIQNPTPVNQFKPIYEPNPDNYAMHVQRPKPINQCKPNYVVNEPPVRPLAIQNVNDNLEVLSVYIRKDKSEKVPAGFQKMHYRGDSCKLHDPTERSKQIMALQQVINETSSGAEIAKSNRRFSPLLQRDTRVMAAVGSPVQLPKTLYAPPVDLEDSDDSLESYRITTRPAEVDRDDDSFDILPQRRRSVAPPVEEEDSKTGLFGCFKRGRPKRQQDSYIEEKNINNRKVTHSDSQPRRHTGSVPNNSPKLSGQYSNKKHI